MPSCGVASFFLLNVPGGISPVSWPRGALAGIYQIGVPWSPPPSVETRYCSALVTPSVAFLSTPSPQVLLYARSLFPLAPLSRCPSSTPPDHLMPSGRQGASAAYIQMFHLRPCDLRHDSSFWL